MKPVNFKDSNKTLTKPDSMTDEECSSLHIFNDGTYCISCWRLTFKDLIRIIFTRKVWLWIHSGKTQPPVYIGAEFPFENRKEKTNKNTEECST